MDQQEQSLIDRIKQAQNVLVTVSSNPSVDQLAAAIGLTLALNKMNKHGTAVFSGQVPNTIEFLKPGETLENNTDSLRDFIIALDKSKADKLRYKVEDQVVRIFITPYKTSLNENDLEFSQGDFNVDVVVALGVSEQQELDSAITAHGRILHDATVASVSTIEGNSLGTINWVDKDASSLSEMTLSLIDGLDKKLLDNQIATALLTGVVANTDRFRNDKTSPKAMSASAELMTAGANQQLIATELERPPEPEPEPEPQTMPVPGMGAMPTPGDMGGGPRGDAYDDTNVIVRKKQTEPGELDIDHSDEEGHGGGEDSSPAPEEPSEEPEPEQPQIHVDENGLLRSLDEQPSEPPAISGVHGVGFDGNMAGLNEPDPRRERLTKPPTLGDASLTANTSPEDEDELPTESLVKPSADSPLLKHNESVLPPAGPPAGLSENPFAPPPLQPAPSEWKPPEPPGPGQSAPASGPAPLSLPTPLPAATPAPGPGPLAPSPVPMPPSLPTFTPPAPSPAAPPQVPLQHDETLDQIEKDVQSSRPGSTAADSTASSVDDARSAVEAALNGAGAPAGPIEPIAALNAQPLGPDLHQAPASPPPSAAPAPIPVPTNTGFSEPTPGNTPADATLDMPLPSSPFGPGQQTSAPPAPPPIPLPPSPAGSPGAAPSLPQAAGQTPPPPVPPPLLPPM